MEMGVGIGSNGRIYSGRIRYQAFHFGYYGKMVREVSRGGAYVVEMKIGLGQRR